MEHINYFVNVITNYTSFSQFIKFRLARAKAAFNMKNRLLISTLVLN
jgi:hypothetical protein